VDEPDRKVGTCWHSLYRAIDEHGQLVDGYLSDRRSTTAAQAFFETASEVKSFLTEGAAKRLRVRRLPGYAPELNPDEGVWRWIK
jgi:transposase-like protein